MKTLLTEMEIPVGFASESIIESQEWKDHVQAEIIFSAMTKHCCLRCTVEDALVLLSMVYLLPMVCYPKFLLLSDLNNQLGDTKTTASEIC